MPPKPLLPRTASARGGDNCDEAGEVVMVRRSAIAPCVTCGLCGGILRDATTISECLHSFCRKCIFKKFEDEDITCCPTCSTDLGCDPLEKLRADHSLICIRLMVFPVKRRKIEAISPLHPALVSQPLQRGVPEDIPEGPPVAMEVDTPPAPTLAEGRSAVALDTAGDAPQASLAVVLWAPGTDVAPTAPVAPAEDTAARSWATMASVHEFVIVEDSPSPPTIAVAGVGGDPDAAGRATAPSSVVEPAATGAGRLAGAPPVTDAGEGTSARPEVQAGEDILTWRRGGELVLVLDEAEERRKWEQLISCYQIFKDVNKRFKEAREYVLQLSDQKNEFLRGEFQRYLRCEPAKKQLRAELERVQMEACEREELLQQAAKTREEKTRREASEREGALQGQVSHAQAEVEVLKATLKDLAREAEQAKEETKGLRQQRVADQETAARLRTERAHARQVWDQAMKELEKEKRSGHALRDQLRRACDAQKRSCNDAKRKEEERRQLEHEVERLRQVHAAELEKIKAAHLAEMKAANADASSVCRLVLQESAEPTPSLRRLGELPEALRRVALEGAYQGSLNTLKTRRRCTRCCRWSRSAKGWPPTAPTTKWRPRRTG